VTQHQFQLQVIVLLPALVTEATERSLTLPFTSKVGSGADVPIPKLPAEVMVTLTELLVSNLSFGATIPR
jgi:hypothetical protein